MDGAVREEPIALAYDDAADGELIAKLYTPEAVSEFQDCWWTRVEIVDERYVQSGTDRSDGGDE
jgi:hypothetical protein